MKLLLTISLLLLSVSLSAQQAKGFWWKQAANAGMGVIGGIADGQREVIVHNKWAYRYRHPNANEMWWNPDSTWKRADAYDGPFVFVADKYHLNQFIRQAMFLGQTTMVVSIQISDYKKNGKMRWGQLLLSLAISQGSYMLSKHLTHKYYDIF